MSLSWIITSGLYRIDMKRAIKIFKSYQYTIAPEMHVLYAIDTVSLITSIFPKSMPTLEPYNPYPRY